MKGVADLEKSLFELIRRTSTDLPSDVEAAIRRAMTREKRNSHAWSVLATILENVAISRKKDAPICQDTGVVMFSFIVPVGFDTNAIVARARAAVSKATSHGYLRQNTIDSVTGAPYETNIAHGAPVFHFQQGAARDMNVRLILKGGGSENVGRQYSLPDPELNAGRDLDGVRRCVLDAVHRAQGEGCPPGVLGICIGGDRATGYEHAKEQFFRKLDDKSPVRTLARLERAIVRQGNELAIGPMGLGGSVTLLGAKIGALARVPASYFVSVSIMCWAFRRRGVVLGPDGGIRRWIYR